MEGYIKLHRQITKWEWYEDANTFRVFIHLLLNANHEDGNWRGKTINRGQRFTSIGHLSSELKISDKAVRIALDKLAKTKELVIRGASDGTMITICKYDTYQSNEEAHGRAKGQTKGKRGATNKNDNNNKEINLTDLCESEKVKTWKTDFETYKNSLRIEYNKLKNDKAWILERERLNPNVDVLLTLEKACIEFWATEDGWNYKLKSKVENINWKLTLTKSISQPSNKVYKQNKFVENPKSNIYKTTD